MTDYRITVLIPAYNAEAYLAESIQSVLDQSYKATEIIVLDDGSDDKTYQVAESFGEAVRLLGPKRRGFVAARNFLLKQASCEWIAFQDADDIWHPDKLEKQCQWLSSHPEHEGCLALAQQFLQPGCTLPDNFRQELLGEPTAQFFIPNLLTSRKVFEQIGDFGMHDATGSDSDWFVRAKDAGLEFGVVQEVLYQRRWHASNLSYDFRFQGNMLDILRRSVHRKRNMGG